MSIEWNELLPLVIKPNVIFKVKHVHEKNGQFKEWCLYLYIMIASRIREVIL